ncbi:unnamed protein product [Rotaria sp. Silwood2]|nr:unnamed protein product [Rotaria sp. Silwood2]
MSEPPANWDQPEEENSSLSSAAIKLRALNVNAMEFVPSFGSGFSPAPQASTLPQPIVSKAPPSTPIDTRNTIEDEKKQKDPIIETNKSNVQQQEVKEQLITTEAVKYDDLPDEDTEKLFDETTTTTTTMNKINTVNASAVPKEKKNTLVKRDIIRKKEPINIVFCGHVDAGKSTIGGQLMFLTGQVDKRTLEKYQNEAREKSRESWYLSWALDTNEEEREKGKTVEVGRAWFETEKKHFIILDAPGHKCFVPNMIGGAAQADIAILVISARKGEFETGFERGGQTREHAMLVKTAGVRYLVVLINKMDDPTVNWDQTRYEEIRDKLTPYLKKCGFKPGEDTYFMPCSGMSGVLLKEHPGEQFLPWYKGPTFIEYLDSLPSFNRNIDGPLRMPIIERYKEMGVIVMGKIRSGCCRIGDQCLIMPNRTRVEITNIYYEDIETDSCVCGENVRLKLKNIEEEEISPGFILCDVEQEPCGVGRVFDAQIAIIEHKSIICPGYSAVLHIHAAAVEVQLKKLITLIDRKTGDRTQEHPRFIKQDQVGIARFELSQTGQAICMEPFKRFPQLGRFTLRDEGRTVAVVPRIKFYSSFRLKSREINLIDELNKIKTKDLMKIFNEEQIENFRQLKRTLGGKFHSFEQFKNESKFQIDFDKFFDYLLSLKNRNDNQQHRIYIEPRLTPKNVADIESVCSLDYTSSHINWAMVKTTNHKNQFQVKQWNTLKVDLDRKYNFINTFNQLSNGLSTIPLKDSDVLLVEQTTYRYPNIKLAAYVSQLQQIRAILNTLLHCNSLSKRSVYHISGRDIALNFGLFIGNEQSSAEFFLTNLIFNNTENNQMISLDIDHQLKINYHKTIKGQREPMAQCLLRALAFLQCVNEKKDTSLHSK